MLAIIIPDMNKNYIILYLSAENHTFFIVNLTTDKKSNRNQAITELSAIIH